MKIKTVKANVGFMFNTIFDKKNIIDSRPRLSYMILTWKRDICIFNEVKHIRVIVQPSNYLAQMCKNTRVFVCCIVTQMSHVMERLGV